ncbi:MAG TPA: hypothetical protein VM487_21060 [Phycisphaerae bacterium]|nr:hypothetical protein [Phycisphaerae bacterium]
MGYLTEARVRGQPLQLEEHTSRAAALARARKLSRDGAQVDVFELQDGDRFLIAIGRAGEGRLVLDV